MPTNFNQLKNLRDKIDIIDDEIISLLAERTKIVREVGAFKKANNIKPLDEERFKEVLKSKAAKAQELDLPQELIEKIYNLIHEHSLEIEKSCK